MGASSEQVVSAVHDSEPEADPQESAQAARTTPTLSIVRQADGEASRHGAEDAARVLGFQAIVLTHERFLQAATAFATELATALDCDRVTLGFVERGHVAVTAVSHGAQFQARNKAFRDIGAAMDEALEQSISVTLPPIAGAAPCIALAHAELVRRQGGAVGTVPMASDGENYGAITLERAGAAFTADELAFCEHVACFLGPVLRLKRTCEQSWSARLARVLNATRPRVLGTGYWGTKLAIGASIALIAASWTVPLPFRLSAPARLEGSIQRVLVAPNDGFLKQAHVRPGDVVKAEQLLAEFAEQDLQLERRKWEGAVAQHENGYATALARSDRAQLMILRAKADEARAQLGLVEQQLARTRLTAPFDGVVIKGDLRQSLGAPVQRGEVLLTLAPAAQFRLILEVDERDIGYVRPGQRGTLVLASMSDRSWTYAVERLTPVAVAKDGRNFFELEAKLDAASPALQPGLEGVAKIKVADATLAWIVTHRMLDWLRLTLWTWGL